MGKYPIIHRIIRYLINYIVYQNYIIKSSGGNGLEI